MVIWMNFSWKWLKIIYNQSINQSIKCTPHYTFFLNTCMCRYYLKHEEKSIELSSCRRTNYFWGVHRIQEKTVWTPSDRRRTKTDRPRVSIGRYGRQWDNWLVGIFEFPSPSKTRLSGPGLCFCTVRWLLYFTKHLGETHIKIAMYFHIWITVIRTKVFYKGYWSWSMQSIELS